MEHHSTATSLYLVVHHHIVFVPPQSLGAMSWLPRLVASMYQKSHILSQTLRSTILYVEPGAHQCCLVLADDACPFLATTAFNFADLCHENGLSANTR